MRPIHSLEDLRAAKKELAIQKKLTQAEFVKHVDTLRNDASKYVIKKVVLPLGIGVATAFAIKFFFFDKNWNKEPDASDSEKEAEEVKEKVEKNSWLSYFSILLSIVKIVQSAMARKQEQTQEEMEPAPDGFSPGTEATTEETSAESFSPKSFVHQFQQQKLEK